MRNACRLVMAVSALALAGLISVAQTAPVPSVVPFAVPSGEILREIDDPHNGDRWLLMRDDRHPGGPGLLLLVSAARSIPAPASVTVSVSASALSQPQQESPAPIIHTGDRVIVEEDTPVASSRLEAVALNPARPGAMFNARLVLGGRVVRVSALAAGRAILAERPR